MSHTVPRPRDGLLDVVLLPRQFLVRDSDRGDLWHMLTPDGNGGWRCSGPPCTPPPGSTVCEHVLKALAQLERPPEADPGPVQPEASPDRHRPHLFVVS